MLLQQLHLTNRFLRFRKQVAAKESIFGNTNLSAMNGMVDPRRLYADELRHGTDSVSIRQNPATQLRESEHDVVSIADIVNRALVKCGPPARVVAFAIETFRDRHVVQAFSRQLADPGHDFLLQYRMTACRDRHMSPGFSYQAATPYQANLDDAVFRTLEVDTCHQRPEQILASHGGNLWPQLRQATTDVRESRPQFG